MISLGTFLFIVGFVVAVSLIIGRHKDKRRIGDLEFLIRELDGEVDYWKTISDKSPAKAQKWPATRFQN